MKPVILLGEGARNADMGKVARLNCPILTTWQAIDLFDNTHPNYFGRPGLYGQRLANKILYEADEVFAIGARLSVWTIGYGEWTKAAHVTIVDIDRGELARFPHYLKFNGSAEMFIEHMNPFECQPWLFECWQWAAELPWVESPTHDDPPAHIHSHRFIDRLQKFFIKDEIIVTDMGSAMVSAFQVLRIVPPQRLLTSGGLGEMGVALPAAIGAAFASGRRVICLHCDGGMMLNIQELQTIIHHNLPIKIFIFDNRGYEMIKGTQRNLKLEKIGVDAESGVSFPDYRRLAHAWGFAATDIYTWDDFERAIPAMMVYEGPSIAVFHMDENQQLLPKIQPVLNEDGTITPPRFDQLSPIL
jgi:acetolactate synthase-1/2/3 large subunit